MWCSAVVHIGPLIFILYINNLQIALICLIVLHISIRMTYIDSYKSLEIPINLALHIIYSWHELNGCLLNPIKFRALCFGMSNETLANLIFYIKQIKVEIVILDNKLDFSPHFNRWLPMVIPFLRRPYYIKT